MATGKELMLIPADDLVCKWYSLPEHWRATGKTTGCVDYVMLQQGELLRGKDVLNLGCFYPEEELRFGYLAHHWEAIDFSPAVISQCRQLVTLPIVNFSVMDMRYLKFADASFDVVLDLSSGDQMAESSYRKVLAEVSRVLRNDGVFIIAFTDASWFSEHDDYWKTHRIKLGDYGYVRADTEEDMRLLLAGAGLKVREFIKGEADGRAGIVAYK